jgi:hypothetical protein
MTKQLADDRQSQTTARAEAGEGVAQVVNAQAIEVGFARHHNPWPLEVRTRLVWIVAGQSDFFRLRIWGSHVRIVPGAP